MEWRNSGNHEDVSAKVKPFGRAICSALVLAALMSNAADLRVDLSRNGSNAVLRWNSQTGELFSVMRQTTLATNVSAVAIASNLQASSGTVTEFTHTNALGSASGFYRVLRQAFTFDWTGTNFTYTDAERTFTGVMLKPSGAGPFPAVLIQHGAGGTVTGYSLAKAREMLQWGLVCIAPTLTHVAGGETNAVNMGFCPENLARAAACLNVLASLPYVDTNRIALFGHSMGAFATIGDASVFSNRVRAVSISAGGIIPDSAGATNAAPTVTEANHITAPVHMVHCDGDPVVPASRSQMLADALAARGVTHQRIIISSNDIPNNAFWHNLQNDANANTLLLTNTRAWFQTHGVLP